MLITEQQQSERDTRHRVRLLSSLLLFTKVMYKLRTNRDFIVSNPAGNEPHAITVCRALTDLFHNRTNNLCINLAPGWGKSEFAKHFVAWALARYPDCNFLYISYGQDLAAKHTAGIKEIMLLPEYQKLFQVSIRQDTSANAYFKTEQGGAVGAFGSKGGITGFDAGLPGLNRFSGCIIMDDAHKPDEAHSELSRDAVRRNYFETIKMRKRSPTIPMLFIGQRVHEEDLPALFIKGGDGEKWDKVILKARADNGFPLYPEVHNEEVLQREEKFNRYTYWAQLQQQPIPAGGGLFCREDFVLLKEEPKILTTFITADIAETAKTYNDASVLSFWGVYKIEQYGVETDIYALHWIDCLEFREEPRFLENKFMQFYAKCLQHPVKPLKICIEKKSAGVTLLSVLKAYRGLSLVDIERSVASGSKCDRFVAMQSYVSKKLISLPEQGAHVETCLAHMEKITANNSHAHDDICDTCYDAIDIALIKGFMTTNLTAMKNNYHSELGAYNRKINSLKEKRYAATR